jgi:hypothetical protein
LPGKTFKKKLLQVKSFSKLSLIAAFFPKIRLVFHNTLITKEGVFQIIAENII